MLAGFISAEPQQELQYFIAFYCQIIFHYVDVPQLMNKLMDIWGFPTFWLLRSASAAPYTFTYKFVGS